MAREDDVVANRFDEADYIDVTPTADKPTFALMGTGFSALDESPNAQTKTKRYISDKASSTFVTEYQPSYDMSGDVILSEAAIKYIADIAELRKVGSEGTTLYQVDKNRPADESAGVPSTKKFHCRKQKVTIQVEKLGSEDGKKTFSGKLVGKGDPEEGTFDISKITTQDAFTTGWTEPTQA